MPSHGRFGPSFWSAEDPEVLRIVDGRLGTEHIEAVVKRADGSFFIKPIYFTNGVLSVPS